MNVISGLAEDDRARVLGFAGRVALTDPKAPIRIIGDGLGGARLSLWARTGFGVWLTCAVTGSLDRADTTVYAADLVTSLAVARGDAVDIGSGPSRPWQGRMPPAGGWVAVGAVDPDVLGERVTWAARAASAASDAELTALDGASKKASAPLDLLDQTGLTVRHATAGPAVEVPVRVLLALSAIGYAPDTERAAVTGRAGVPVRATATWLRIDTVGGSVLRHGIGLPASP